MVSKRMAVCAGLLSMASGAQAAIITPNVVIQSSFSLPASPDWIEPCPDGGWTYELQVYDGAFALAFTPRPQYFHLRSGALTNGARCGIEVGLTIPKGYCYTLQEILITGRAELRSDVILSFPSWDFVPGGNPTTGGPGPFFIPRSDSMRIMSPHSGDFMAITYPVLKTDGRTQLTQCKPSSEVYLNFVGYLTSESQEESQVSTAKITKRFLHTPGSGAL